MSVTYSHTGDPTTTLDRDINRLIAETLPAAGEGWLSEESEDRTERLQFSRVWIVDPIDGTREFVEKVPEWCVSIALVENHQVVAGGILNPSTGELLLGAVETGLEVLGAPGKRRSAGACILVSRREHREGKWAAFDRPGLDVIPVGSIAYRLALVAAGYADAACTFEPRNEWDIAGGIALILAAGGTVHRLDGSPLSFNEPDTLLPTLFTFGATCPSWLKEMFDGEGATSEVPLARRSERVVG